MLQALNPLGHVPGSYGALSEAVGDRRVGRLEESGCNLGLLSEMSKLG